MAPPFAQTLPPANEPAVAGGRGWGETNRAGLRRLDAGEIRSALLGRRISYNPPGWADTGMNEEYREDGAWRGIHLGRGPDNFSGRWRIANDRLCTTPETGLYGRREEVCREIWRDARAGDLLMEHLLGVGRGLMRVTVRSS